MSSRAPHTRTTFGLGGFGGPPPRDLIAILAVLFVTFSLQFFASTQLVVELLRLTRAVWQAGFVWQAATYPFIGYGPPSIWFLLELYILFIFGRDVYTGLGRRHFWMLVLRSAVVAAVVAVAVDVLMTLGGAAHPAPFTLMQGQRALIAIFIAAFATANRYATIMLFFVLPIQARWFLPLEVAIAFIGFLQTKDLAGFVGFCTAVGLTWASIRRGGAKRGLRETRLKLERWWLQRRLERERKRRGLRVVPGDRDVRRGPWTN